jgi:FKBP-type peptidyl-prolyl cis-trans isomerase FklB
MFAQVPMLDFLERHSNSSPQSRFASGPYRVTILLMRKLSLLSLIGATLLALACPRLAHAQVPAATPAAADAAAAADKELPTQKEKSSYAVGMNIGNTIKKQQLDLDDAAIMRGLQDMLAGKALLTDDQAQAALTALAEQVRAKQDEATKKLGETNMKEGADFLAANKTKDGVVVLPSGLQYKIITAGSGAKPGPTDTVVCNYRGTLINGTEFDSSYKRGQPASFPVNGVIKGWTEALQLMPVGSKWQLFVPSDLAYGTRGAGGMIGPNTMLIFEVELLSIQGK